MKTEETPKRTQVYKAPVRMAEMQEIIVQYF